MMVVILTGKCYPTIMAKYSDSKEKTLLAAAKLFCRQGYHGTALQDILAASGAPRGSLYFHFPRGKEEIAEGAVAIGENVVRGMAANLEASDFREGCPLATTALEIATDSETIGKATREAFAGWEREIEQALVRFGVDGKQAAAAATAILSQVEGALLLARTYRSLEPMRRAEEALRLLVKPNRGRRGGQSRRH